MAAEHPQPPQTVADLAESCKRAVKTSSGFGLDDAPETLPLLDHYVDDAAAKPSESAMALLAPICGAYFGEVIRKNVGASHWHIVPDHYEEWRLVFDDCNLEFNPIGIALEAIQKESIEGWSSHFATSNEDVDAIREVLDQLGSVRESDYYHLSIRFEAVDLIYSTLMSRRASLKESSPGTDTARGHNATEPNGRTPPRR